jgi:hypothetical protein
VSDWPPTDTPPPPPPGPPGPGWWLASDGRYYPPEQAPGPVWSVTPPPQQYGGPVQPHYGGPTQTNGLAIAAMVLGILWLYWIGSILALVFGYVAKKQIDESGGRQSGRGMAIAGIVLGWIGVAALALFAVFSVFLASSTDVGEINTDPSNGVCNEERFLQDPDC